MSHSPPMQLPPPPQQCRSVSAPQLSLSYIESELRRPVLETHPSDTTGLRGIEASFCGFPADDELCWYELEEAVQAPPAA
jgi:hypothetical protein